MPTIAEAFEAAYKHHASGNLRQAEVYYHEVIGRAPAYAAAYNNLGAIHLHRKQHVEAERYLRQGIAADASHPGLHYNLGMALMAQGRHAAAEAGFREAIRLRSDY